MPKIRRTFSSCLITLCYKVFGFMWTHCTNQQCLPWSQSSTQLTRVTCDNIGGYFTTNDSESTTAATVTSAGGRCYYYDFHCPNNYTYGGQCYSNRSSTLSCPTCNNIGGVFAARYGCYFYSNNCRYLSAGGQCHTNRWYIFTARCYAWCGPCCRKM